MSDLPLSKVSVMGINVNDNDKSATLTPGDIIDFNSADFKKDRVPLLVKVDKDNIEFIQNLLTHECDPEDDTIDDVTIGTSGGTGLHYAIKNKTCELAGVKFFGAFEKWVVK